MRRRRKAAEIAALPLLVIAVALLAVGCGDDSEQAGDGQTSAAEAGADGTATEAEAGRASTGNAAKKQERKRDSKPKGTTIELAGSQFGQVLFDGEEQAIYMFDKETTSQSECYGRCAVEWPPVLTKGRPRAKGGVAQNKLGTIRRKDGEIQVTYNGRPLYYYFNEGPTELRCHNVPGFGGLWLALGADGDPV